MWILSEGTCMLVFYFKSTLGHKSIFKTTQYTSLNLTLFLDLGKVKEMREEQRHGKPCVMMSVRSLGTESEWRNNSCFISGCSFCTSVFGTRWKASKMVGHFGVFKRWLLTKRLSKNEKLKYDYVLKRISARNSERIYRTLLMDGWMDGYKKIEGGKEEWMYINI